MAGDCFFDGCAKWGDIHNWFSIQKGAKTLKWKGEKMKACLKEGSWSKWKEEECEEENPD